jgi:hypothetical protein
MQNFTGQQGVGTYFKNVNLTETGLKLNTFLSSLVQDIKSDNMVIIITNKTNKIINFQENFRQTCRNMGRKHYNLGIPLKNHLWILFKMCATQTIAANSE